MGFVTYHDREEESTGEAMGQWSPEVFPSSSQIWLNQSVAPVFTNLAASIYIASVMSSPAPDEESPFQQYSSPSDRQPWQKPTKASEGLAQRSHLPVAQIE